MEDTVSDAIVMIHKSERADAAMHVEEMFDFANKRQRRGEIELKTALADRESAIAVGIPSNEMAIEMFGNSNWSCKSERFSRVNAMFFQRPNQWRAVNCPPRRWIRFALSMGHLVFNWLFTFKRTAERFQMRAVLICQGEFKSSMFGNVSVSSNKAEPIGLRFRIDRLKERFIASIGSIYCHVGDFTPAHDGGKA